MANAFVTFKKKSVGDTAVDGLIAGLPAGLGMAILLMVTGLAGGTPAATTLGYFDPARSGNWLTGLLAHLAVAAIYGVMFALVMGGVARIRPSLSRRMVLWGAMYGLVLLAVAYGVWFTAVDSPLAQVPAWQMGAAHVVYGVSVAWLLQQQH